MFLFTLHNHFDKYFSRSTNINHDETPIKLLTIRKAGL